MKRARDDAEEPHDSLAALGIDATTVHEGDILLVAAPVGLLAVLVVTEAGMAEGVVAAAVVMVFSMLFGTQHGLLLRWQAHRAMKLKAASLPGE